MPDDVPLGDHSLSLQFSYDGLDISLVAHQVVEAPWAPSEDIGPLSGDPGFWYELRNAQGAVLWRRSAVHPIWFESEGPTDDSGAMGWTIDTAPSGAFAGQVPFMTDAASLALVGSPPPGAPPGPVKDLAVFDLGGIA